MKNVREVKERRRRRKEEDCVFRRKYEYISRIAMQQDMRNETYNTN